ncbi:LGFP repeat-containing protein [Rothia sp. ZJ932]|uniref:LGFP repeat-containing protein n=1 Tax=Rothia sp. ZJ932 TaxID=2810516 RepID=UPI00196894C1|nr:hypothetical protein [Rothia sp. ZJ932]QRZ61681.1 hypothetical protein JR346_00585 [Rothia sp. ZJ932]
MTILTRTKVLKTAAAAVGVASALTAGLIAPAHAVEPVENPAVSSPAAAQPTGNAYYQPFDGGVHVRHDFLGTHTVRGGIFAAWHTNHSLTARGASQVSDLMPTTNETPIAGGFQQAFGLANQGRGYYFWSEATGAHFVDLDTAAGQFYIKNGGPQELGFPTGEVVTVDGVSVLPTQYGAFTATFKDGAAIAQFIPNPAGN